MTTTDWARFAALDTEAFADVLRDVQDDMADLLKAKRSAYGPHNLTAFGTTGVLVRMHDKLQRLIYLHRQGLDVTAVGEHELDAYTDLAGYALLVLVAAKLGEESQP